MFREHVLPRFTVVSRSFANSARVTYDMLREARQIPQVKWWVVMKLNWSTDHPPMECAKVDRHSNSMSPPDFRLGRNDDLGILCKTCKRYKEQPINLHFARSLQFNTISIDAKWLWGKTGRTKTWRIEMWSYLLWWWWLLQTTTIEKTWNKKYESEHVRWKNMKNK